jgi:CheY-like chemotaxis protein
VIRPEAPRRFQQTRRVLVVDDDLDNARMMAEVLGDEGYEVQVAPSAEVALQMWERRRYDAALLDALMPDVTGWELAKELRKRTPQALLAIVTGMDVRGQNRANLALVDAVFRKPIDVGALDEFLSQSDTPSADPSGGIGPGAAPH